MSIHKIGSDLIRPHGARGVRDAASEERSPGARENAANPNQRSERSDRVQISAEGRELAARILDGAASETRLEDIRARIERGYYDDPVVVEETARRILESGDL